MCESFIRINALVFHKNATVAEVDTALDEFWIPLGLGVGYVQFIRQHPNQERFLLRQVRSACSSAPGPLVSVRGVLWSRQAAREADLAISSYLEGINQIEESSTQSMSLGCHHES